MAELNAVKRSTRSHARRNFWAAKNAQAGRAVRFLFAFICVHFAPTTLLDFFRML